MAPILTYQTKPLRLYFCRLNEVGNEGKYTCGTPVSKTVTMGFGGLVDGYWCYHQTCDTVDEMIDWMDTTGKDYGDEQSGTSNLVDALDTITWWATYSFFHLDENPVRNAYL